MRAPSLPLRQRVDYTYAQRYYRGSREADGNDHDNDDDYYTIKRDNEEKQEKSEERVGAKNIRDILDILGRDNILFACARVRVTRRDKFVIINQSHIFMSHFIITFVNYYFIFLR